MKNNNNFLDGVLDKGDPSAICNFMQAWVGPCKNKANECEKHRDWMCLCGNKATWDCAETHGPMCCGRRMCDDCKCNCRANPIWPIGN